MPPICHHYIDELVFPECDDQKEGEFKDYRPKVNIPVLVPASEYLEKFMKQFKGVRAIERNATQSKAPSSTSSSSSESTIQTPEKVNKPNEEEESIIIDEEAQPNQQTKDIMEAAIAAANIQEGVLPPTPPQSMLQPTVRVVSKTKVQAPQKRPRVMNAPTSGNKPKRTYNRKQPPKVLV
jgi:ABC-type proline/glycine betaine transport system ATPase subunit